MDESIFHPETEERLTLRTAITVIELAREMGAPEKNLAAHHRHL
jgi:hypothetical protein